jgi:hypothetical protein
MKRSLWYEISAVLFMSTFSFAQPQSPNYIMANHTFSAAGQWDSSAHFRLESCVSQWSPADTQFSPQYRLTGGFLGPSYGASAGAFLQVNPMTYNFDEVHIDSMAEITIAVQDTGYWNLLLTDMQFRANNMFHLVPVPDLPDTIRARDLRRYTVQFLPTAAGLHRDTLDLSQSAGNSVSIFFAGQGTAPGISLEPDSLPFGDLWINRATEDSMMISNPGSADLHVSEITSDQPLFPSVSVPFVVPRGGAYTVLYAVTVPETLSYHGVLTVHSDAGEPAMQVSAHGVWTELRVNSSGIFLGPVAVGDSVDTTLTLASAGNTGLTIDTARLTAQQFRIVQFPADSVSSYGRTTLTLRFVAHTLGEFADTLIIEHSVGAPLQIPLTVGVARLGEFTSLIPKDYFLDQNYPNPFNPSTRIRFGLPRASRVIMDVYDILGRKITTMAL